MEKKEMIQLIQNWLNQAAQRIRQSLKEDITVAHKSNRTDLVTNMDREIQQFLMEKITHYFPNDKILAEENDCHTVELFESGRVWIIDPIDGTLNFVLEQENFCIMLAVYEDGIGQLGFIYDVMTDVLYWGGKEMGVYKNHTQLNAPADLPLSAGLVGINSHMFRNNLFHTQEIADQSMGVRMSGCAGIELIALLKGSRVAYLSNLSPWDYAAGLVLLEEFGFHFSNFSGELLSFCDREYFLASTPKVYKDIQRQYLN